MGGGVTGGRRLDGVEEVNAMFYGAPLVGLVEGRERYRVSLRGVLRQDVGSSVTSAHEEEISGSRAIGPEKLRRRAGEAEVGVE